MFVSEIEGNGHDKVLDQSHTKSTGSAKDKKVPEGQKFGPGPYINLKLIFKKPVIVNIHEYTEIHITCNFSNTCIEQILPIINFSMKVTIHENSK